MCVCVCGVGGWEEREGGTSTLGDIYNLKKLPFWQRDAVKFSNT